MIKNILFIIAIPIFMLSCEKEDVVSTGKLIVEFENPPSVVSIYPIENQTRPLFEIYMEGKNSKAQKMNMGNYYCVVGDIDTNYAGVLFQIQPGNTTKIVYKDNSPTVIHQ